MKERCLLVCIQALHTRAHPQHPLLFSIHNFLPPAAAPLPLGPQVRAEWASSPGWQGQMAAERGPKSQWWQTQAERQTKMGTGHCARGDYFLSPGELGENTWHQSLQKQEGQWVGDGNRKKGGRREAKQRRNKGERRKTVSCLVLYL